MTLDGRLLTIILERRGGSIRVIMARDAGERERRTYRRHNR